MAITAFVLLLPVVDALTGCKMISGTHRIDNSGDVSRRSIQLFIFILWPLIRQQDVYFGLDFA